MIHTEEKPKTKASRKASPERTVVRRRPAPGSTAARLQSRVLEELLPDFSRRLKREAGSPGASPDRSPDRSSDRSPDRSPEVRERRPPRHLADDLRAIAGGLPSPQSPPPRPVSPSTSDSSPPASPAADGGGPYKCELCSLEFPRRSALLLHVPVHI